MEVRVAAALFSALAVEEAALSAPILDSTMDRCATAGVASSVEEFRQDVQMH